VKRLKVREREREREGKVSFCERSEEVGTSDLLFKAPKARKILSLKGERERG
jgi:hypothetical protein